MKYNPITVQANLTPMYNDGVIRTSCDDVWLICCFWLFELIVKGHRVSLVGRKVSINNEGVCLADGVR